MGDAQHKCNAHTVVLGLPVLLFTLLLTGVVAENESYIDVDEFLNLSSNETAENTSELMEVGEYLNTTDTDQKQKVNVVNITIEVFQEDYLIEKRGGYFITISSEGQRTNVAKNAFEKLSENETVRLLVEDEEEFEVIETDKRELGKLIRDGADRIYVDAPLKTIPAEELAIDENLKVCILDTGVGEEDANGHGTVVASYVTGEIISVKVLDENGIGYSSDVIEGIEECIEENADVILMYFGYGRFDSDCDDEAIVRAAGKAVEKGIIVISPEGDSAPGCGSRIRNGLEEEQTVMTEPAVNIRTPLKNINYSIENEKITFTDFPITDIKVLNWTDNATIEVDSFAYPGYIQTYAVNPIGVNFAEVSATAKGRYLYKCKDWNFTERECYGEWIPLMRITPGQKYTFVLGPGDPALGESGGTFFEGFESGSFSTNNWTVSGPGSPWLISTTDPYEGTYYAQARRPGVGTPTYLTINISTENYSQVTLSYYRKLVGIDGTDEFNASWFDGTGWTLIEETSGSSGNDGNYLFKSFVLPAGAANNSDFALSFGCVAGAVSEYCRIDNISVSGFVDPPDTLFYDDFESGNFSTKNWTLSGTGTPWIESTNDPYEGVYHAQVRRPGSGTPSYLSVNISTENYGNITLNYYRKLVGIDGTDEFNASWFDGTGWTLIEETGSGSANEANYVSRGFSLPAGATDNPDFALRFGCMAGAASEYCRIDNVQVNGIAIDEEFVCGDIDSSVVLTEEVNSNGTCFNITADNVVLDCAGHTVTGNGSSYGVYINNRNNITVENCTIQNFADGIHYINSNDSIFRDNVLSDADYAMFMDPTSNTLVENNIYKDSQDGLYLEDSHDNTIRNNRAYNTTRSGFYLIMSTNNTIYNNTVYDNPENGFYLHQSSYNRLQNNTAYSNLFAGFFLNSSNHSFLINNTAHANKYGIYVDPSYNNTIIENNLYNNSLDGLYLEDSHNNTVRNNTAHNNTRHGFFLNISTFNNLTNNTAYNNSQDGFHIDNSDNNVVENNTAYNNSRHGFNIKSGSNDNNLLNNIVYNNSQHGFNFYASSYNNLTNNTANNNLGSGFLIQSSSNNNATGNVAHLNDRGFFLDIAANNTLTNNNASNSSHEGFLIYTDSDYNILINNIAYNNVEGFKLESNHNNSLTDNTAYTNGQYGLYISNSSDTNASNTHLYDNSISDFYISTDATPKTVYLYNLTIDNPTGNFQNYTSISITDIIEANTAYRIDWTTNSAPPSGYFSFREKYINITNATGSVSIDSITWRWLDSELTGYNETNFELWKWNATSGWSMLNDTPDTSSNTLGMTNMNPASDYGILENSYTHTINETVNDAVGKTYETQILFISEEDSSVAYNQTRTDHSISVPEDNYTVIIRPKNHPIENITINNFEVISDMHQIIDVDEPDKLLSAPYGREFNEVYAIEPQQNVSGNFTVKAKGKNLYTCADWHFEYAICEGEWEKVMALTIGQYYTLEFNSTASAYGEGGGYFTLRTITIDGDMSDWAPVLENSHNGQADGVQGIDDLDVGQTADRDFIYYAFTWDDDYYYSYFRRVSGGNRQVIALLYIDVDNDGKLESTDKLVKFIWPNTGVYDATMYNYTPSNVSGDPITGDGVPEPGSYNGASAQTVETNMPGGETDNIRLETRINWSLLGLTPGSPIRIHASAARGSASLLPGQVEDNINATSTQFIDVDIEPDREGADKNGQTVYYNHTVTNLGNLNDTININTTGTIPGFTVNLTYANGTPLVDTNNDSYVDVGLKTPGESVNITVAITISGASSGDVDETYVLAISSNNYGVTDSVLDTTKIGDLVIYPNQGGIIGRIINGSTIIYNHTVVSNLAGWNVIDINATSNNSYVVNATYANGTYLTDTDGSGLPDIGNVSSGISTDIRVRIGIPSGAAIGSKDTTIVVAQKSGNSSINSSVTDITTVSEAITIVPNRTGYIPVDGFVFYDHKVINSLNVTTAADITNASSRGWNVYYYYSNRIDPLNDTDGDGIADTGPIAPFGSSVVISVKIEIPGGTTETEHVIDLTNITANASNFTNAWDMVTDNTTVRILLTYNDSARTKFDDLFNKTQTVYAKAFGLSGYNKVFFRWYDSNGTLLKQSVDIDVDAQDQAQDSLGLNQSMPSGQYALYLHNAQGDAEITHEFFWVFGIPNVIVVSPDGGEIWTGNNTIYYNISDDSYKNITSIIQYSPNGGSSWFNITTQQLNTTTNCTLQPEMQCVIGQFNYSWDTTTVSDGSNYLIRVLINNSYYIGSDQSNSTFTIDNNGPVVTLNSPLPDYYNDSSALVNVMFNCSAVDVISGLKNISLYITNPSNESFALNSSTDISGSSNSSEWTLELENGDYTWNCLAYDIAGNYGWGTPNRSLRINGSSEITNCTYISQPNSAYLLGTNLVANKTDSICITINASNISLNCAGYSITGLGGDTSGIAIINSTGARIENCTVGNYSNAFMLQNANDSVLRNNTGYNSTYGFYIDPSYNNSIIENQIFNNSVIGLYLYDSHNNTIRNNTVYENTLAGIFLNYSSNNSLYDNNISNNTGYGISYRYSNYTSIYYNTLDGNSEDTINGMYSDYVNISYNTLDNGGDDGIFHYLSTGSWIIGNNMSDTIVTGSLLDAFANDGIDIPNNTDTVVLDNNISTIDVAVRCDYCGNVLIDNNHADDMILGVGSSNMENCNITHNILVDATYAVYLIGSVNDVLVHNNSAHSSGYGFYLNPVSNSTFADNIVYNNTNAGIYLNGSFNNIISDNNVSNNINFGIEYHYSNYTTIYRNTVNGNPNDGMSGTYSDYVNITYNNMQYGGADSIFNYVSSWSIISNNVINNSGSDAIDAPNNSDTNITYNNITNPISFGMRFDDGDGLWVYNNDVNGANFSLLDGASVASGSARVRNSNVSENHLYQSSHGFYFIRPVNNTFSGNHIHDSNVHDGMYLSIGANNTFIDNRVYDNTKIGFEIDNSTNNTFRNNSIYNNGQAGIDLDDSDNNTFRNNTINSSSEGVNIYNSSGNEFYGDVLYYNGYDVYLDNNPGSRTVMVNISAMQIRNPAGTLENYTIISLNDSASAGEEYAVNWTAVTRPLPTDRDSFREKWVNITTMAGTVSIDSITWHWLNSELTGYNENYFELWKWNVSAGWTMLNDTPDTTNNILAQTNMNPASDYGILQNNSSTNYVSIYAAPFDVSDFSIASSSYEEKIHVEFNSTCTNLTSFVLASMNLKKISGPGINRIWARVKVDGVTINEELLRTMHSVNEAGSTGLQPITFEVGAEQHNITVEFRRTGLGIVNVYNNEFNLGRFRSTADNDISGQLTEANYQHTLNDYEPAFNWTINKSSPSRTYLAAKGSHRSTAADWISYYFENLNNGDESPTWERYLSSSLDVGSMLGVYISNVTGTANWTIESKNYLAGRTTTVNMSILDFDLMDNQSNIVNSFFTTNASTNWTDYEVIGENWTKIANYTTELRNGTGLFLSFTATSQQPIATSQTISYKINLSNSTCNSQIERTLTGTLDAANVMMFKICDNLTTGDNYTSELWARTESGRTFHQFDESFVGFETTPCNITVIPPEENQCRIINSSGTYGLTTNAVGAPNNATPLYHYACIKISASDVEFDCNGYNITDNGTSLSSTSYGIMTNESVRNVTIRNCPGVSNYTNGIYLYRSNESTVENSTSYNVSYGFHIVRGTNNLIRNCTAYNTTNNGFYVYLYAENSTITDCTARNSLIGFAVGYNSSNNTVANSTSYGNSYGVRSAFDSYGSTFRNISATYNSQDGFYMDEFNDNTMENNTAYGNSRHGIYLYHSSNNSLTNNVAYNNSLNGFFIYDSNDNRIENNIAYNNSYGFRLDTNSTNNTLMNNTAYNSTQDGFHLDGVDDNNLINNSAYNNSNDGFEIKAGSDYNVLEENMAYNNSQHGFHFYSDAHNNLTNNIAHNNVEAGFFIQSCSNHTIRYNTAYLNNRGFFLDVAVDNALLDNYAYDSNQEGFLIYTSSNYNILRNNTAYNNTVGFTFSSNRDNNINDSRSYNNSQYGFHVSSSNLTIMRNNYAYFNSLNGFYLSNSYNNTISNSTAHNNSDSGFYVDNSPDNDFISISAYNNSVDGLSGSYSSGTFIDPSNFNNNNANGVNLNNCHDTKVDDINASDNKGHGLHVVQSDRVNITNSIFCHNHQYGIRLQQTEFIRINNSDICNNTEHGVEFDNAQNTTINFSRVYNNSDHGLHLENSDDSIFGNTNVTYNIVGGVKFDANSDLSTMQSDYVCFNGLDINNLGASNNGTLDSCGSWNSWNESGHSGCTFRCTEIWHYFYGDVNGSLLLTPDNVGIFYNWIWNGKEGKVYVMNGNATVEWINLTALGRTTAGAPSTNDFAELDTLMGYGALPDNINITYSSDGSTPKITENMTLQKHFVPYVPQANSSVFDNNFTTGITWDASQGGPQFNTTANQDVVFVTEINDTSQYDYEIRIPANLSTYKGTNGVVEFWLELE